MFYEESSIVLSIYLHSLQCAGLQFGNAELKSKRHEVLVCDFLNSDNVYFWLSNCDGLITQQILGAQSENICISQFQLRLVLDPHPKIPKVPP